MKKDCVYWRRNEYVKKLSFSLEDQRSVMKFSYLKGYSAAEIRRKLVKTSGNGTSSEGTVREWCKRFTNGDRSVEDQREKGRM